MKLLMCFLFALGVLGCGYLVKILIDNIFNFCFYRKWDKIVPVLLFLIMVAILYIAT